MLKARLYAGQELDSLIPQAEAEGHTILIIIEDEDGNVVCSVSQSDNQGSGFEGLDFLTGGAGNDDDDH